jgi:hypothetical protein
MLIPPGIDEETPAESGEGLDDKGLYNESEEGIDAETFISY